MSLTIAFSSEAKRDLKRLYRRHPSYADELLDMLHDEVRVQGRVPDAYDPHILDRDLLSTHAARVPAHTAYLHPCRA